MRHRLPFSRRFIIQCAILLSASMLATAAQAQPSFSKAFQPDVIGPGSASTLVFTISGDESAAAEDLAFTDNLPAGMTIADPGSPASTCGGTVSAPDGGSTISFSGGSVGPVDTCQVQVDVTSSTLGTHTNVSGDLTSSAGNSGTATDDLTVEANRPGFTKSFSPATVQFGGRSTLTFVIDNSLSESTAFFITFTDNLPTGLVVAGPSNASTSCTDGTVDAVPGGDTITFSGGSVAALSTCTVSLDVTSEAAGQLTNRSGELTSTTGGPSVSSGKAVAALAVEVDALALTKSFTDDPVPPGGTVNLRFSITNFDRDSSATGITFSDDLDATLTGLVATGLPAGDVCGAGSTIGGTGVITLTGGNLGPGETCTFDVTLQVPAGATPGAYPNTTSQVSGDVGGTAVTGAAASDDLFVESVPVFAKRFLDAGTLSPTSSVAAGDEVVMEFEIANSSSTSPATDIAFSDDLSAFVPGASATMLPPDGFCGPSSTISGATLLSVSGASLAPAGDAGDTCTFEVTVQIPSSTSLNLYTNLTSEISATVNEETVTGPPASADLSVLAPPAFSKAFASAVPPGGTVDLEFSLEMSENAPGPATDIAFTDDLDAALAGLAATGLPADGFCGPSSQITGTSVLSVTGASLDSGTACNFTVTVEVPASTTPGTYTNTTSGLSAILDGEAVTGPAVSADLRVIGLALDKSFPDSPAVAGGTTTLAFTLDNSVSPLAATNISFTDDLGNVIAGMTATALPADGFCGAGSQMTQSGDVLTVSGAEVAAGATCSFEVTVQVPAGTAPTVYINQTSQVSATIDSQNEVLPPAAAELEVIDPLAITKSFIDDPVAPGDTVTLEFTLTNNSPVDTATGLAFTDDLDAALAGMTAVGLPQNDVCGAGSQISGTSVLTLTGGNLGTSSSCTFQVTVQVPAGAAAGSTVINTTSELTGNVGGVSASAPPASDELRIDLLTLTKSFASPAGAGGTVVLSFLIDNQSTSSANNLGFTDDLGATLPGLQAVGLPAEPCGAGSSLTGTSILALSGGALDAGTTCSFDVTLQVPAGASPGDYLNTTSSLTDGGLAVGTPATATLSIEPPPIFSKTFTPAAIAAGGISTITFHIDNVASTIEATGLAFTDDLPAGLSVAATPNASTTCGGTLTANPGAGSLSLTGGSIAAGEACTVSVDVTGADDGTFVNTTSELTSSLGSSGTASDTLDVVSEGFAVLKAFQPDTALPGDLVDLELSIVNASAFELTGISLTDDLDAALSGLAAEGLPQADVCGAGSQLSGTTVITLTGGNLPAGGSCTFTVAVRVPIGAAQGGYLNTTSPVSGTREGVAVEADPASAELNVAGAPVFTKSFEATVIGLGEPTTLTFTIDNSANTLAADNLSFTDNLPSGMVVAETPNAGTTCTGGTLSAPAGAMTISYSGGSVAAGATCIVTVDVVANVRGFLENVTDNLSSSLGTGASASASVNVQRVDPIPALTPAALALLVLCLSLLGASSARSRMR